MSVQAGVWRFNDGTISDFPLRTIGHLAAEFGPDGKSINASTRVAMLYMPFYTNRESRMERQPCTTTSGRHITWDGRLDNRDDLAGQLRESLIDDRSDLSLVCAAIEQWGNEAFSKFRGDWALVVWDPRTEELTLARDYIGVRPLFYWLSPEMMIWSSHLEGLVSCGSGFGLSHEYVAGYLTMWPQPHLTPYRDIQAVPPGHFIQVRDGRAHRYIYWKFDPYSHIRYRTDAEYEEHFRHLFRQSIQRRLRTDSPCLAELSGGFDSSSIVCMADKIRHSHDGVTPLDTFSYYDPQEPDDDDFAYFPRVEESRGRSGHHLKLESSGDTFSCVRPDFFAAPSFGGRREIDCALKQLITKCDYRVILSGTGGDELLGQALDPRVQLSDLLVTGQLAALRKQLGAWSVLMRRPWIHLLNDALVMCLPTLVRVLISRASQRGPWVNARFATTHKLSAHLLTASAGDWRWLPSRRDWLQTLLTLSGQLNCVAPGLAERRYPYLDQDLVEFLSHIPTDQLVRPGERRSLMCRALKDLLPREIAHRRTKSAEGRCYALTLSKHWREIEILLAAPRVVELGFIEADEFRKSLAAMKSGQLSPYYVLVLRALLLETWLREVEGRGFISLCDSPRPSLRFSGESRVEAGQAHHTISVG